MEDKFVLKSVKLMYFIKLLFLSAWSYIQQTECIVIVAKKGLPKL